MFKAVGNIFQGVNSIAEGARKKRDGRKFIKMAEARARNAEQMDFTNHAGQVKVSGRAQENALESINLNATEAFSQASDAGIRGIGMIGKIQQNVNTAIRDQENRLAEKEFAVQQARASEESRLQGQKNVEIQRQEGRTDSMLERGQALRSQGSAEVGQGASQTGGAVDAGLKEGFKVVGKALKGDFAGAIEAIGQEDDSKSLAEMNAPQTSETPSNANTPFNQQGMLSAFKFRRK